MNQGSSILIKNLTIKFSEKTIIDNFSLSINSGENVIIYGSNGCGKTTLLKALMSIVKITSGTIEFFQDSKLSIAYCAQEKSDADFPISVKEVLSLAFSSFSSKNDQKVLRSLEQTGCKELLERNFFSLSGGEKQRVSLARCLCQEPTLLLLDEPSTYLDASGRKELYGILDSLAKTNLTILMVTHEKELFEHFSTWRKVKIEKEGL